MKKFAFPISVCFCVYAFMPAEVMASTPQGCNIPDAQRLSWSNFLSVRLQNHDHDRAAQLSRVVSEIITGNAEALQGDLNGGLDPNTVLKLADTPQADMSLLTLAASACQVNVVKELVAAGAKVDGVEIGMRPIVAASGKGDSASAEFLAQHGAQINILDGMGHSALEDAVRQHQLATVKILTQHGANPNKQVGPNSNIVDLVAGSTDPDDQAIKQALAAHGATSLASPQKN